MDATLTAPAPMPDPAPASEPVELCLDDMSLVQLIEEMKRAHDWDEPDRMIPAYSRARRLARLLTGEAGDTPRPEDPDRPLFAVQHLGGVTREWMLTEVDSSEGRFQVLTRTRCSGRMGPWARSGNAFEARDREEAARYAGSHYANRNRIQWTSTEDGRNAQAGDEASRGMVGGAL